MCYLDLNHAEIRTRNPLRGTTFPVPLGDITPPSIVPYLVHRCKFTQRGQFYQCSSYLPMRAPLATNWLHARTLRPYTGPLRPDSHTHQLWSLFGRSGASQLGAMPLDSSVGREPPVANRHTGPESTPRFCLTCLASSSRSPLSVVGAVVSLGCRAKSSHVVTTFSQDS